MLTKFFYCCFFQCLKLKLSVLILSSLFSLKVLSTTLKLFVFVGIITGFSPIKRLFTEQLRHKQTGNKIQNPLFSSVFVFFASAANETSANLLVSCDFCTKKTRNRPHQTAEASHQFQLNFASKNILEFYPPSLQFDSQQKRSPSRSVRPSWMFICSFNKQMECEHFIITDFSYSKPFLLKGEGKHPKGRR